MEEWDVEDFDEPSSMVATESSINNPWEDEAVVDEKDVKHLWEDDDKPKSGGARSIECQHEKRNAGDQKGKKAATNQWHKSDKDQSAPQPNNAKEIKLQTISPGFCLKPVSC
ncbi:unnamed protein product [Sphagnum troendelagicum]|uniref:Uncharacterized protein n=1 Tax=Sphagnum troendelagicum TaxID=128251 RepID=A0ABP0TZU7_9BRYO